MEQFKEALQDINEGASVNGEIVNNLKNADDTVIIGDSKEGLQVLMNCITRAYEMTRESHEMTVNTGKTTFMIVNNNNVVTYLGFSLNKQRTVLLKTNVE